MLLPLFPLPSRPTELIQFRQPNIADAMRFNSITPEEQEQQTTAYLKALLAEPAKHDPRHGRRRTGLPRYGGYLPAPVKHRSRHSPTPVNIAVKSIITIAI